MRLTTLFLLTVACNGPAKDSNVPDDSTGTTTDSTIPDDSTTPDTDADGDGIATGVDCDDNDPSVGGPTTWYVDSDGDSHGNAAITVTDCEERTGFVATGDDCNDLDAGAYTGANEVCDGADNDCDGATDDADDSLDLSSATTFYADADQDGDGDGSAGVAACAAPAGTVDNGSDCDDTNPAIHIGAAELCDGLDNDCDGSVDTGAIDAAIWASDADSDGYGNPSLTVAACSAPTGYVGPANDCDDTRADIHPGATETCTDTTDFNCDGSVGRVDNDNDGYAACEECDDRNAIINPGATETCNGLDDNCNGAVDDGATGATIWYADGDGDSYGDAGNSLSSCTQPTGYVEDASDCDDSDAAFHPGAAESCTDTVDFNCDGSIGYSDNDGDGYAACEECNDGDAAVNPAATEICDGIDNNCDAQTDDSSAVDALIWYLDADRDNYGTSISVTACNAPSGYTALDGDCDDGNRTVSPLATEVCDGIDNDCDGATDDSDASLDLSTADVYYVDADGDNFGDAAGSMAACVQPAGYVTDDTDCDDNDAAINPDTIWYIDVDGDGHGVSTYTTTSCTQPSGYVANNDDCDDSDASAFATTSYYLDNDGDGYGDASTAVSSCTAPTGYVADATDCNDNDPIEFPGAIWYADTDKDGYGNPASTQPSCLPPTGYVADATDCNDGNNAINPAAAELCDSIDNDCDNKLDDNDPNVDLSSARLWYIDTDKDGYGSAAYSLASCGQPSGYVLTNTDCNDGNNLIYPGSQELCDSANVDEDCDGLADDADSSAGGQSTWYADADGDTYGNSLSSKSACDQPAGYVSNRSDCNDSSSSISPAGQEVCDSANVDEDCDGTADDADSSVSSLGKITLYRDGDSDGYGDASSTTLACDSASGYVSNKTDCDDGNRNISPAAQEVCDASNTDEDCDGLTDDGDSSVASAGKSTWYADTDGDTYGSSSVTKAACDQPSGYVSDKTDCNDSKSSINPAATEVCDAANVDEDCDGLADDLDSSTASSGKSTFYGDGDKDTYGDASSTTLACDSASGYVSNKTDCDDGNKNINPGAQEVCDSANTDEDCDGLTDDGDSSVAASGKSTWYADTDGDTYGSSSVTKAACDQPSGYVSDKTDCNDSKSSINPGAQEVCDAANTDEDCDGLADDSDSSTASSGKSTFYRDGDKDTYGDASSTTLACDSATGYVSNSTDCDDGNKNINPAAQEICDSSNVDEDCDGLADDADSSVASAGKSTWYADVDGDTYGNPSSTKAACDLPTGYVADKTDCNDSKSSINPAATEVCDASNTDEDCDGLADDLDTSTASSGKTTFYRDGDKDTYGDASSTTLACDSAAGYVSNSTDCDDGNKNINPAASEICDASDTDEDCDGLADDADSSVASAGKTTFYRDADGDTYGSSSVTKAYCDIQSGYVTDKTDCNDASASINPGAQEVCDASNTDEDCDGLADDADPSVSSSGKITLYRDGDKDGYGDASTTTTACDSASGYIADSTDCDDGNKNIYPGAQEICDANNVDEDCDGLADDNDSSVLASGKSKWYRDADGDTYGLSTSTTSACDQPTGYVSDKTDCNDAVAGINPGAQEVCDTSNVDEDCDNLADDSDPSATGQSTWYQDKDGDGYGNLSVTKSACDQPSAYVADSTDCNDNSSAFKPGGTEICDASNADEDCDGLADDADPSATGQTLWYYDGDGDGYGLSSSYVSYCDQPSKYVSNKTDCNDSASAVNPGATEVCQNGVDDNCDGSAGSCSRSGTVSATTATATWTGETTTNYFGYSYNIVGDMNNDGYDDAMLGAYYNSGVATNSGSAYMLYGGSTLTGGAVSASYGRFSGGVASDYVGYSIAPAGDVNRDGYDDALIGSYGNDQGASSGGAVWLIYGQASKFNSSTTMATTNTPMFYGTVSSQWLGYGCNSIGDIDRDGYGDFALGNWNVAASPVYLVFGQSSKFTGAASTSTLVALSGEATGYIGRKNSIGYADLNGDLYSDAAFGAEGLTVGSTSSVGGVYVVLGGTTRPATNSITTEMDQKITGLSAAGDSYFGHVAGIGDYNNDGYEDLAVGAHYYDSPATDAGGVWVIPGKASGWSGTVSVSTVYLAAYTGAAASDYFGFSVQGVGDVNKDGIEDLLATAYLNDGAASNAGAAYVFYGSSSRSGSASATTADFIITGKAASDDLGYSQNTQSMAGDMNADGYYDILVGAPYNTTSTGAVYLFTGTGL